MSDLRKSDQPPPGKRPLPPGPAVAAAVLLLIPVVVLLIVPIYARKGPEFLGFPFFYWFQMAAVIGASALTFAAYLVVQRARRGRGDRR